ncbi:MAG: glycosyltransferase [Bacteroidales bacterium]
MIRIEQNPLVSVIVVTYNSSRYVLETLESIRVQTYKNIELIICDDSSTDETVELCRDWVSKNKDYFKNIELITSNKNTGISANSNRGIMAAKGTWLKLIAGDDLLLDNCILENLLFVKDTPNAKFISSKVQPINNSGKHLNHQSSKYDAFKNLYFTLPAKKQLKMYARLPVFLNSPSFFLKKEVFKIINYFDEEFRIYDDICLIYRANSNNVKIHFLDKFTVKYRIHENAISRNNNTEIEERRKKEQILIFNKYRRKNLNKWNLIDLSVYYETWLNYKYKGFRGFKMVSILQKFSFFYWYLKCLKCLSIVRGN